MYFNNSHSLTIPLQNYKIFNFKVFNPKPPISPVTNLLKFVDSFIPKYCKLQSVSITPAIIMHSCHGTLYFLKRMSAKKYDMITPVHLAHTGNW